MALCVCFYPLTNLFFSHLPDNYELSFWEEIWGCVKVIGIPFDTVWSMPVQHRKILIQRYNYDGELREKAANEAKGGHIGGESINTYAEIEMKKLANNSPI